MGGDILIGGKEITPIDWSVIILSLIYVPIAMMSFREAAVPTGFARFSATFAVYMGMNIFYQGYVDVYFNGLSPRRVWVWMYFCFFIVNNWMFYFETQKQSQPEEGAGSQLV